MRLGDGHLNNFLELDCSVNPTQTRVNIIENVYTYGLHASLIMGQW